ncbi:MAG: DUF1553 domain-containing protein, partial [Chthoniobacteraceae bacterium]
LVVEPLALFDFAEASLVTGQRQETSVPAQALYLMNSPLVLKQSEAMAARLLAAQSLTPAQRVEMAFQWAFGRAPTAAEAKAAGEFGPRFVQASGRSEPKDFWIAFCQSLFAAAEFRTLN